MSLTVAEVARILIVLTVFLIAAHLGAYVFARLRQPPVIGEIVGGLLLGGSALGLVAPSVSGWLAPSDSPTAHVLGAVYQLGTILMVFLAGLEMRQGGLGPERRTVLFTTVAGLVIPFAAGLVIAQAVDAGDLAGPHGSGLSISLVLGLAIAVTSIPVISRIMFDLGIMGSLFARTVLTVAVVEDVLLYVVLAVILGLAHVRADTSYGLHALFHTDSIGWDVAYYVAASLLFFAVCLAGGRRAFRRLASGPLGALERRSPAAFRMVFLFALCVCCMGLGIDPIFGALMAGMAMAEAEDEKSGSPGLSVVRGFSLAFFVPIYFALVGFRLDLVHDLDLFFFSWLFVLACVIKFCSVWAGARLSGKSRSWSTHFAVAMNARGGPGIILASVTFGAGIINGKFLVALVLLSILTSQLAGVWLTRVLARDPAFVSGDPAFVSVEEPHVRVEVMPGQRPGANAENEGEAGGGVQGHVEDRTDRMASPAAGEGKHPKAE
ncbi:cation:proton antiporter [Streptomyces caniscabiei]|uniref:cation:proton antiporter n=1 Tax=Streptomyces caniscabiei TaxID=2746961 RepID=UPI001CE05A7C|nr:cation:proton antiporter [Streptomyces caniscabiei]MDX3516158.1 cation:proton antiporter [Streptomyces caniscabiei]MDX3725214.1 cation:proton antiporter [Streptomyces caniscabiei]MDX3733732.1 cation:proton antiporter [Streptomyces caniscabiei]WEO21691.1 cation:proton antiporter [Streptomyces caniscabiei]